MRAVAAREIPGRPPSDAGPSFAKGKTAFGTPSFLLQITCGTRFSLFLPCHFWQREIQLRATGGSKAQIDGCIPVGGVDGYGDRMLA